MSSGESPPRLAIAFVAELGRKFKAVGQDVVCKLIASSLVNPAAMSAMAELAPDVLKPLALAA